VIYVSVHLRDIDYLKQGMHAALRLLSISLQLLHAIILFCIGILTKSHGRQYDSGSSYRVSLSVAVVAEVTEYYTSSSGSSSGSRDLILRQCHLL